MLFGKIDYINLAPFHIFLKKNIKSSQLKQSIEYKKSFPSHINLKFKKRKIDAAFISSIESRRGNFRALNVGIVAKKEIRSVIVKKDSRYICDSHSATSNALAKVLKVDGEVIIGDRALKLYIENQEEYVDLAKIWHDRHNLPFVFARFCVVKHYDFYKRLVYKFLKTQVKIPRYILSKYAKKRGISCRDIEVYLKLISYNIDKKSEKSLKLFLKETR